MANEKTVSELKPRRAPEPGKPGAIATEPAKPGDFQRNPCGECWHWQPVPRLGLDMGRCMAGPPFPMPVLGQNGQPIGQTLSRPHMKAGQEGCDVWDDESEFVEDDGHPADAPALTIAGGG